MYVCTCMYDVINHIVYDLYIHYHTVWHMWYMYMYDMHRYVQVVVLFDSTSALTSHRVVELLYTIPVSKVTLMWWTISSGQEPVSTWPTWYGDCTALNNAVYSVYTVHDAVTDVMIECTYSYCMMSCLFLCTEWSETHRHCQSQWPL